MMLRSVFVIYPRTTREDDSHSLKRPMPLRVGTQWLALVHAKFTLAG